MPWFDELIERILRSRKQEFYIVASGITTSGPPHLGTLMEFIIPSTIVKLLRSRGLEAEHIFVADVMDAFDSVPAQLKKFKELEDEIGKPLARVMDPYGCHRSYGEHFLDEMIKYAEIFDALPDTIYTSEQLYREGWYDDYLRLFYSRLDEVRELLERTALRKLPSNWMGIAKPICQKCGRIDSTDVTYFDGSRIGYKCSACGHESYVTVESHEWKLLWRLDWPSRQDFLGVDVEGAGVDHHTRGGSWDTAVAVHREIFGKEPPIGFKYGFVLLGGRKMSKSKGVGSLSEILEIVHPCTLKYFLLKHDLEENRIFDTNPRFISQLFNEYILVSRGKYQDEKQRISWQLSCGRKWEMSIEELAVHYQLCGSWDRVLEKLGAKYAETIRDLAPYVERWLSRGLISDEYIVKISPSRPPDELAPLVKEFADRLSPDMSDIDIHNLVYEIARSRGVKPSKLFEALYITILGKSRGPRLGRFIKSLGIENFKEIVRKVLGD